MSVLVGGNRGYLHGIHEPLTAGNLAEMLSQNPGCPAPDVAAAAHG
jgi:hypothetical protein